MAVLQKKAFTWVTSCRGKKKILEWKHLHKGTF